MTTFPDRVQLSVMRALLGAISPPMRAVTVEIHGREVTVRVFHDGAASPDLEELVSEVDTEIRADYPAEGADAIVLETRLVRCDAPRLLPAEGLPVFSRHGTQYDHQSLRSPG